MRRDRECCGWKENNAVDEAIIKYYRRLLRAGFQYAGSWESPTIFLDTIGEGIRICGNLTDYIHLYVDIRKGTVSEAKYLCACDPAANVAVEILCSLVTGKTLAEVATLTECSFCEALGSESEELRGKAKRLLQLLDRGIARYRAEEKEKGLCALKCA